MDFNTEAKCSMMFDAAMVAASLLHSGEIDTPNVQFICDDLISFMDKWATDCLNYDKHFKECVRRYILAKYSSAANSPGRKWYDIESQSVVTELQLYEEYLTYKQDNPDMQDVHFEAFIANCMTRCNGTLERIFGL